MKVLVDTDIGSDIDDALCLSYLLRHPGVELLGITTVSGEAETRARLASMLVRFYGKKIPIAVGKSEPTFGKQYQPRVPQSDVLDTWPHSTTFVDAPVEDFLADQIRRWPGEVTLLAIGPLTNVATLFKRHPDCAEKLGQLVSMNGRFSATGPLRDVPEWNALCDVSAAYTVYHTANLKNTLFVSSDVTRRLVMHINEATARLDVPALAPVQHMAKIWFTGREKMTFHDPLAAVLLHNPDLCTYKFGMPEIDRESGLTTWDDDQESSTRATEGVDISGFFTQFFSYFQPAR